MSCFLSSRQNTGSTVGSVVKGKYRWVGCRMQSNFFATEAAAIRNDSRWLARAPPFLRACPQVRGLEYHRDLAALGRTVRRVLLCLCAHDPAHQEGSEVPCMQSRALQRSHSEWTFTFAREPLAVMAFAPLYPPEHTRSLRGHPIPLVPSTAATSTSRSDNAGGGAMPGCPCGGISDAVVSQAAAGLDPGVKPNAPTDADYKHPSPAAATSSVVSGATSGVESDTPSAGGSGQSESCFLVFQPESSFLWYDIGDWVPGSLTNFHNPTTYREGIRKKFQAEGKNYPLTEEPLPMIHHTLRPVSPGELAPTWWKADEG